MLTKSPRRCPSDETLGALVACALDEGEATSIGSHLDTCRDCQDLVIALMRARGAEATLAAGTPVSGTPICGVGTPTRSLRGPSHTQEARRIGRGTRIGRYVINRPVGVGGMGIVYEAYDAELDRAIALKVLHHELVGNEADRLVRESRLMARVVHRSVITVYDAGRAGDTLYIAMELVRGETLASYLMTPRPWREIVRVFEHAGQGLAAAHAAGIVHRDFKPENVLIETGANGVGRVLVTDFGIARIANADESVRFARVPADVSLTATGSAIGTPAYMAPEQHAGKRVDARADVFAFCASLWEALCGERPFPGTTLEQIREGMRQPPRVPRSRRRSMPRRIVRALQRGLAWNPARRWPGMPSLLRQLRAVRSRHYIGLAAAGAAALVAIGVVAAMLARSEPDPCAPGLSAIEQAFSADDVAVLKPVLGPDVLTTLTVKQQAWRETHLQTCRIKPQPVATAACLEARRIEIAGFVDDAIADRGLDASELTKFVGDPRQCAKPPSGLLAARMPVDPVLRRKVTAVRRQIFAAMRAVNRGERAEALRLTTEATTAGSGLWPPLTAGLLYVRGTVDIEVGDLHHAATVLREAAVLAESVHYDYIAAAAWTDLVQVVTFERGDPERALEYATYAEAAISRIGNPPEDAAFLKYARGTALIDFDRLVEGEALLREAMRLAETASPEVIPEMSRGLGYLYELKGRHEDAIAAYRRSTDLNGTSINAAVMRGRTASALAMLGRYEEAEQHARAAVAIVDQMLPAEALDRLLVHLDLANALTTANRPDEALAVLKPIVPLIAKTNGDRSVTYATATQLEGVALLARGHARLAERKLGRACDIFAFAHGPKRSSVAICHADHARALETLGRKREARLLLDAAIPILTETFGLDHQLPETARRTRTRVQ